MERKRPIHREYTYIHDFHVALLEWSEWAEAWIKHLEAGDALKDENARLVEMLQAVRDQLKHEANSDGGMAAKIDYLLAGKEV